MILEEIRSCQQSLRQRGEMPNAVTIPKDRLWEFVEAVAGLQVIDARGRVSTLTELEVLLAINQKPAPKFMGLFVHEGDRLSVFGDPKRVD